MEKDLRHDEDPELSEEDDSENEEDDGGDPSDDDLSEPRFRHAVEKAAATKFAIEDFYENFSKHLKERTDRWAYLNLNFKNTPDRINLPFNVI